MSSIAQQPQGIPPSPSASAPQETAGATSSSLLAGKREAAFLDLVFETDDRPRLVTDLLALVCADSTGRAKPPAEPPRFAEPSHVADLSALTRDDSPLWSLSVATRLKRLLQIVRDSEGITALPLRLRCPHADCRQFLEIELAFADLDALHDEASDQELLRFPGADSRPLVFRRPTGDDLRRWRSATVASRDPQAIFRSLLVIEKSGESANALPSADACAVAFSEFDALVAFQLTTTCPHCGRESTHAVDLETLALTRLHALQQRLYRENHQLARAYGWSESDILSVPRARRLRYLAQLETTS